MVELKLYNIQRQKVSIFNACILSPFCRKSHTIAMEYKITRAPPSLLILQSSSIHKQKTKPGILHFSLPALHQLQVNNSMTKSIMENALPSRPSSPLHNMRMSFRHMQRNRRFVGQTLPITHK